MKAFSVTMQSLWVVVIWGIVLLLLWPTKKAEAFLVKKSDALYRKAEELDAIMKGMP